MERDVAAMQRLFEAGVRSSIAAKERLLPEAPRHARIVVRLAEVLGGGNQLLIFGNGGSAADAQHIAAELVGRFYRQRRALPVLALTTNTSSLTAIGNDMDFADVFARQVEAYGRDGDAVVALSTSGNAANVLAGVAQARTQGLWTIGLTGRSGGRLAAEVDDAVCVDSDETARVQESHILIGHLWCQGIEALLFGADGA